VYDGGVVSLEAAELSPGEDKSKRNLSRGEPNHRLPNCFRPSLGCGHYLFRVSLGHQLSWDASAYFVDRLRALGTPAYTRVDTGVTWRPMEKASISIVGQNLETDHRLEYLNESGLVQSGLVKRSVYGKLSWQF
jgi:hypothetical protein